MRPLALARLRRETSAVIRETSARLKAALAASGTGTFRWNFADNSIIWDDALLALFGLKPGEEMTFAKFMSMVHPEDREAVRERCRQCVSRRRRLRDGVSRRSGGRPERWLLDKGLTAKDAAGQPLYT